MALPAVIGMVLAGVSHIATGNAPTGSAVAVFAGIALVVCGMIWWGNRCLWEKVFRQSRGRTIFVEGSDLVLCGPGTAFRRMPLSDVTIHARSGAGGILSLRIFPHDGSGPVHLFAFEEMEALVREIDAAIRNAIPDHGWIDALETPRHRWRPDLARGAKRRLRGRFIRMGAFMVGIGAVLTLAVPPSERIVVGLFLPALLAGIFGWIAKVTWKQAMDPVRGSVAFVEAGMLILERENAADVRTVVDLCESRLHLREHRTQGILDELWLCRGGTIVLRLFGFENLDRLRDEIAVVLSAKTTHSALVTPAAPPPGKRR